MQVKITKEEFWAVHPFPLTKEQVGMLPDFIILEATPVEKEEVIKSCLMCDKNLEIDCSIHGEAWKNTPKLPRLDKVYPDDGSRISALEGRLYRTVNELIETENARRGYFDHVGDNPKEVTN